MKRVAVTAMCAGLLTAGVMMNAQAPTPFKLGTFQLQNRTFIGIVVRDTQVIDFAAADSVIGRGRVAAPADMKQLIERYEAGVRERIYADDTMAGVQPHPNRGIPAPDESAHRDRLLAGHAAHGRVSRGRRVPRARRRSWRIDGSQSVGIQ